LDISALLPVIGNKAGGILTDLPRRGNENPAAGADCC